ncbi:MAG: hypothetical protein AAB664_00895 [Patescibacteria group bacterium]
MFRSESFHQKKETEYLDEVILRVLHEPDVTLLADALLSGASQSEPLFLEALQTPQDPRYHAEGSFMHAHVRTMLCVLYGMQKEKLHLIDIEELRRLKGYEGEIEKLEETIKENIGLFEVFALMHDAAKWACIEFTAPVGSLGEKLGFNAPFTYEFDVDAKKRVELRQAYLELFHEFSLAHRNETSSEVQKRFYEVYRINIHYPHHAEAIYTPVYSAMLDRFCAAHRLSPRDRNILEDLIGHHMFFNGDFANVRKNVIKRYVHLAQKRGYDAELFLDLLQGCLFFDMVCGSCTFNDDGCVHDATSLIHCLKSEHDFAPKRRAEKEALREIEAIRMRNRAFQQSGLDGIALMEFLEMKPGVEFGNILRQIQLAILEEREMPPMSSKQKKEIEKRVGRYYQILFNPDV